MLNISEKITSVQNSEKKKRIILLLEIVLFIPILASLQGGTGVGYDEASSWNMAVNFDLIGVIQKAAANVHPPFYYFVCKFAIFLFGKKLRTLVWVSIIPCVLGMLLSSAFICKRWGFKTAFLFNLAYGFAPFLLEYNIVPRMYSLMDFLVLGVLLYAYECVLDSKALNYIMLFVFSILAVFTQYFSFFPIAFFYLWLFIRLIINKSKKGIISLVIVGVCDVLVYLPWLLYGMKNVGINNDNAEAFSEPFLGLRDFWGDFFESGLIYGSCIAFLVFCSALLFLIVFGRRFSKMERSFLWMLLICIFFCCSVSQVLGKLNGHLYVSRYMIYCIFFIWLIMAIVFSRCNILSYVFFFAWTVIICISSYKKVYSITYDSTPLMPKTMQFVSDNIEPGELIVYDGYPDWYIIWKYYFPDNDLVAYKDFDPADMAGKDYWMINMQGTSFSAEEVDEYDISIERYPNMGFKGIEVFEFWKISEGGAK